MAPRTSPGKTWEGFVFGTAATMFVTFVTLYKQDFLTIGQSLVVGAVVAVAAPVGDLFESMLKRDMDVKDTGTPARRPRRHARPHRRPALRRPGRVLHDPGLLVTEPTSNRLLQQPRARAGIAGRRVPELQQ